MSNPNTQRVYASLTTRFLRDAEQIDDGGLRALTKKSILTINTPLYATLVYQENGSIEMAVLCHYLVLDEARYILLLDYFHENGEEAYKLQAEATHQRLLSRLKPDEKERLLGLEKLLVPEFFGFERELSNKLKNGDDINNAEIQEYTFKKSEDVFLYATVAGFVAPIPRQVINELYHQQLLRDFEDDCRDLSEDFGQRMPNPLIMRIWQRKLIDLNSPYTQQQLEILVRSSSVFEEHMGYLNEHIRSQQNNLPPKYAWLSNLKPSRT